MLPGMWLSMVLVSVFAAPAIGGARQGGKSAEAAPEVPPEIAMEVYRERREALMRELGGCTAVLKSYASDGEPDPYFYYLTGISDPGAVLVLAPRSDLVRQAIYLPPRDAEGEKWTGQREEVSPTLRKKYLVDEVGRLHD